MVDLFGDLSCLVVELVVGSELFALGFGCGRY